jgi:pre-mRNA-splicing factor SPF27
MAEEESGPEIYDSLPYYDNDLEQYPNLKEVVEREFATVSKPPTTLHPKVPPEALLFTVRQITFYLIEPLLSKLGFQNNPLLAAELKRVENHEALNAIDSTRYQVPAPLSSDASIEDWEKAVQNARAQMEHQGLRYFDVLSFLCEIKLIKLTEAQTSHSCKTTVPTPGECITICSKLMQQSSKRRPTS